jgi:4,5-DOPA dioxygenase extradiol
VAHLRSRRSAATRDPRRLGALVCRGLRRHRHAAPADDPRLLRVPEALFEVEYPAPGDTSFAEEVAEMARPAHVGLDHDSWGLDHGTWSVLVHAFPQADVPVVQLAIDARKDFDFHFELGARLAPLRERGVLILGSGNVVHNLRAIDGSKKELGFDWAHQFDEAARAVMTERPEDAAALRDHTDYRRAAPTPDHFIPLLHVAGLASASKEVAQVLIDGYALGSLSMTSFTLDAKRLPDGGDPRPGGGLPDPRKVPAEDTNA